MVEKRIGAIEARHDAAWRAGKARQTTQTMHAKRWRATRRIIKALGGGVDRIDDRRAAGACQLEV